jgi:hypothetical protein
MNTLDLLQSNLLSPMVLAFALGAVAVLVRSDLRIPPEVYTALSTYLLLAIGIKGGQQLSATPLAAVWRPAVATVALGVVTPLLAYGVGRAVCRFGVADAAALAAHYGSVSAVTFAAVLTFLDARGVAYEGFMPALVAVLEVPAIVIGVLIARLKLRGADGESGSWATVLHEVLTGRSVLLLVGGLAMGWASSKQNVDRVAPLFVHLFFGALVLFLLDMGTVAAQRLRGVGRAGWWLAGFGVAVPMVNGVLGVLAGQAAGLSMGGGVVLGVMSASASYIAAPAAVRIALPQANPAYYLTAAIGVTFPFNLVVGIPLVYGVARSVYGG